MNEFIEPKRIEINFAETLKEMFGETLIHDVQDGHRICSACGGLGIVKDRRPYDLSDRPDRKQAGVSFPYKDEAFHLCPNCFSGVVPVCRHCNADIPIRSRVQCQCSGAKNDRDLEEAKKADEVFAKARKIEPNSEEAKAMGMLYYDGCPNEGYVDDMDEFIEWWEDNHEDGEKRPEYIWGTLREKLRIDAEHVIENACDELHEDAADSVSSDDFKELKDFLDKWSEKQVFATTYWQDSNVLVRVPWEGIIK